MSYEYEEDLDILYISNNPEKERAAENLVIGNIVVDISDSGKVLGVEIDSASRFLNFPANQLKNLKNSKIEVMRAGNMLALAVVLATPLKEHTLQFAVIPHNRNNLSIVASC
ncbi:DUF2283 domain-containing protein [Candidatus Pacearchaeota archaeon]|nr:DUF2283 domain-containing protein [Candidatus Pacearchaeota archaeon]